MFKEILLTTAFLSMGAVAGASEVLASPDGDIRLTFDLTDGGRPTYSVDFKGRQVIAPSHLGFDLVSESGRNSWDHQGKKAGADALSLRDGFKVLKTVRDSLAETWTPVWGEEVEILNKYNSMTVELEQTKFDRKMNVEFRVFDDGVAFRYDLSFFAIINNPLVSLSIRCTIPGRFTPLIPERSLQ